MIFQNELARKSAAPIVRSCEDRKLWFSRLKSSRIGACHPRGIDFQMKGSRRHAAGSRQNFRSQESAIIFPNSAFSIAPCSLFSARWVKTPKGSRRGALKLPMFWPSVCPRCRRTRRKLKPKGAQRMPHGHSEIAARAVEQRAQFASTVLVVQAEVRVETASQLEVKARLQADGVHR